MRVYVVDDSVHWAETLAAPLREDGYDVTLFNDGLNAAERIRHDPPDILITDYFMAQLDGGKLCGLAKSVAGDKINCVIVTGGADRSQNRPPSPHADAVVAKNHPEILLTDLRTVLGKLRTANQPPQVVGYERLHPRVLTDKLYGIKRYLEALQEGIGDCVFGVDAQLRIYSLNQLACDLVEQPEAKLIARPIQDVLGLEQDHPLMKAVGRAVRSFNDGETAPRRLTTTVRGVPMRVTVSPLPNRDGAGGALVIGRDISDLLAAEEERRALNNKLHHSDKMAALGQLIAGICHEINNPLAAILPNLKMLEQLSGPLLELARQSRDPRFQRAQQDMPDLISDSLEAAGRIAAITREMREFSHPRENRGEACSVDELLDSALALVANELKFRATVKKRYGVTRPIVVDRARLSQTFLNIILNAVQSFEQAEPERNWIEIETREVHNGIDVRIANNGPPIPEPSVSKVFEPFYTTKEPGVGTGLGLSLSYDTVKRHGGVIEAESGTGRPTVFSVWLPFDTGMVQQRAPVKPIAAPVEGPARLLLIDDERILLSSFRRQLERSYEVMVAESGEEALQLLKRNHPFDLVICDLLMPGMTGMDLFRRVEEASPHMARRFLFLTGGTFTREARQFLRSVSNPRAFKPLEALELRTLVAEALRRAGPSAVGEPA